jgi:hypothetical protein
MGVLGEFGRRLENSFSLENLERAVNAGYLYGGGASPYSPGSYGSLGYSDETINQFTRPQPYREGANEGAILGAAASNFRLPNGVPPDSGSLTEEDDQQPRSFAMATNTYKLIFNFIEASGATWSEVHYRTADSAVQAVVVNGSAINARLRMLHSTCLLRNIRAFNVTGGRDSFTANQNYPGTFVDATNQGPAPAGSAAVASFGTVAGRSVYHWMRGVPSALISESPTTGFPTPPAALVNAIKAWCTQLGYSGCGSRTISNVTNGKFQIVSVTPNPTQNTATIAYVIGAGQVPPVFQPTTPNNRLVIGLASKKDFPGLNGHWSIVAATTPTGTPLTGTVTIRYIVPNSTVAVPCNGYLKVEAYSSVNLYTSGSLAYYGTHSTRSIFSNSRGAKHANRLRVLG